LSIFIILDGACRVAAAESLAPASPSPWQRVNWIHIQKTSSWIGDVLALWACPQLRVMYPEYLQQYTQAVVRPKFLYDYVNEKHDFTCERELVKYRRRFGFHIAYSVTEMNRTAVAMFRKPVDRIISSFLFNVMQPAGLERYNRTRDQLKAYIQQSPNPFSTYVKLHGINACQTKMVMGHACGGPDNFLNEQKLKEAKRRIRYDFAFIGLTEESVATAQLFEEMHGHWRPLIEQNMSMPYELKHRKNKQTTSHKYTILRELLLKSTWVDFFDDELYKEAQRIFYERCNHFFIPTLFGSSVPSI
jgi:hypothetical protein